jgi:hypothetical protein
VLLHYNKIFNCKHIVIIHSFIQFHTAFTVQSRLMPVHVWKGTSSSNPCLLSRPPVIKVLHRTLFHNVNNSADPHTGIRSSSSSSSSSSPSSSSSVVSPLDYLASSVSERVQQLMKTPDADMDRCSSKELGRHIEAYELLKCERIQAEAEIADSTDMLRLLSGAATGDTVLLQLYGISSSVNANGSTTVNAKVSDTRLWMEVSDGR